MKVLRMADLDLRGKRVLIREDLNVPVAGRRRSRAMRASAPRCRRCARRWRRAPGSSCCRISGDRRRASYDEQFSLAPVAARLSELLGKPVPLRKDWLDGVDCAARRGRAVRERALQQGREEGRGGAGARAWPRCATCSSWTRSAPRIAPRPAPTASRASRRSPVPARCWSASWKPSSARWSSRRGRWSRSSAGSKVSTKLTVLESLLAKVDKLIVGGGIANTFLAATGVARRQVAVREATCSTWRGELLEQAARARRRDPAADRRGGGHGVRGHRARARCAPSPTCGRMR